MTVPSVPSSTWWRRIERDVLSVSGPDAVSYLQGQCSQDVAALEVGASTEALLLSPQGKIEAWVRCTRIDPEGFVLDTDAGSGAGALARLERFRLRTKVVLEPLDWACVAVRGPDATAVAQAPDGSTEGPSLMLAVAWPGYEGVDLLGPAPHGDAACAGWVTSDLLRADLATWDAARIEAGIPMAGKEITEATIAAEVGLVERTVSFTKGCYTGQELVARLDARGSNVARRLCRLVLAGDEVPPPGAEVWTADGSHESGMVTSSGRTGGTGLPVALALVHRRIELPGSVLVRWEASDGPTHEAVGEVRPLPAQG
jgi:folate-binding protein YgfZ